MSDSRRLATAFSFVAVLAFMVSPLSAQRTGEIEYQTFTLDNGLEFIVHEDHSTPLVAVHVWYDVGSAHESAGRSGFAHLFEHMMFEDTENLDPGDFKDIIHAAGGTYNGTTNSDRTAYFETMPSNRLNLAFWLEAERMARLHVTQENFDREREVVKEERRLRIDNQPYGEAFLTLDTLAADWQPYKHTVIGSMEDLDNASTSDVQAFYDRFYVPNNATVAVAGDVTVEQVRELAHEYFGDIPRGPEAPDLPPPAQTPRTDQERRVVLEDDKATVPLYMAAYNVPPADQPDIYALELLASIFAEGESSRLFQRLVKEEEAALQVFSGLNTRVGPSTFQFFALPNQGVEIDRIESLIQDEIDDLQNEGVTARELQKAKNQKRANIIQARQSAFSKAYDLQQFRVYRGGIPEANRIIDRYEAVTREEIRRVAREYLTQANRTVVIAQPPAGERDDQTTE